MLNDPQDSELPPETKKLEVSREQLYRAVVGPKNQDYYVTRFLRFDALGGPRASWNWSASFFTFYWMLYRKMWGPAMLYLALPYALMISVLFAVSLVPTADRTLAIGMFEILYFLASLVVPPMCANALYYRHCNRLMSKLSQSKTEPQQQLSLLAAKGGTSSAAFAAIAALSFLGVGGLSAIAIPAYQDYAARALVAQAEAEGRVAATSVARYFSVNQRVPATLVESGFMVGASNAVSNYAVDADGIVSMTIAAGAAKGLKLFLVPVLDDAATIHWHCLSRDIPKRQLPKQCRG